MSGSNANNVSFNKITANSANIREITTSKLNIQKDTTTVNYPTDSPFIIGDKAVLTEIETIIITNEYAEDSVINKKIAQKQTNINYGEILCKDIITDNFAYTVYLCKISKLIPGQIFENSFVIYNKLKREWFVKLQKGDKKNNFRAFSNDDNTQFISIKTKSQHECKVEHWEIIKA